MPLDSMLVSAGVFLMFAFFAAVLAWADHSTTSWTRSRGPVNQSKDPADASHLKKAAWWSRVVGILVLPTDPTYVNNLSFVVDCRLR